MADSYIIKTDQKRDFSQGLKEFNEKFPNGSIVAITMHYTYNDQECFVFKTSDSYRCAETSSVDLFFNGVQLSPGSIERINQGVFNDERMFRLSLKEYEQGEYKLMTIDDYIKHRKDEIKARIKDTLEDIKLWREDIRDEKKYLRHITKNVNTCYKMLNEKYKK
jgi:Mg2+ and Co2+ transporter CorA